MDLMPVSSKTQKIRFVTLLGFIKNDVSNKNLKLQISFAIIVLLQKRNKVLFHAAAVYLIKATNFRHC